MRGGFLRGENEELIVTSSLDGAAMVNGFLRDPDGALVVSGDVGGGGGAVSSVNGQTGRVILDASDVGAAPAESTPGVVVYDNDDSAARPDCPVCLWVGFPTQPVNMASTDIWIQPEA